MRALVCAALALAGCNSLVGFDLEGGEDGGGGDTKTLMVTRSGAASGTVTSMPPGINCSAISNDCSGDFLRGSMVTLTATGAAGAVFGGWSGAGCSGASPCTLTLSIDTSVDARFDDASDGHNFAFVTAAEYPPTFGSLANADAICSAEATAAGLPGNQTYVAWLSTTTVDAKTRLTAARGWVRTDGKPVADTVDDLVGGKVLFPLDRTSRGTQPILDGSEHSVVITGTNSAGLRATSNCADWTDANGTMQIGGATYSGGRWTQWFQLTCLQSRALYCFGTSRTQPVTITPVTGRLAFITNEGWTSGGGRDSADALCQTEASMAGRSGTFKALMATTTSSAASRFDESGPPWVRVDGIPVAAPGTSLFADGAQIGISLTLAGASIEGVVATGAATPNETAILSRNCDDWTVANSSRFRLGVADSARHWFSEADGSTALCSNPTLIYCLQE